MEKLRPTQDRNLSRVSWNWSCEKQERHGEGTKEIAG